MFSGERSEDKEDLLQEQGVQEAHPAQSHAVQEGQGQPCCPGEASL